MYIGVITNFQKEPDYGHQIPHYKVFSCICFSNAATGSLLQNNIYINYPDEENNGGSSGSGNDDNNGNPAKENALITFSASVEGRNITRAMSPWKRTSKLVVCLYSQHIEQYHRRSRCSRQLCHLLPGVLTGNLGYKMYLSNAIYSFYAVSCNSTSPAPTFTNGLSEPLSNGVDYLWWHAVHQDIASSQVNIPITYQHAATQVVVAIAGGENITLNKILSATITPPKPGAIMDLSTGIITSEVSYDKAADMGINDFTVQYIMLPVKSSSPMTLTLELMVNGESFSRTYTTPLTPPNNLLSAGNSYLFRAVINENSISFANVSVKEWTEVDESGNPLYPVQD